MLFDALTQKIPGDDSSHIVSLFDGFLEKDPQRSQPFLAALWLHAVHRPHAALPEYYFAYNDSSGQPVEFPENSAPQEEEKDELFEDFTYEDLSTLGDSVGTVKVGLSQETLGRMRTVKYSSTSGEVAEEKCTICQVEFEEGEDVLLLPCKHVFHGECIAPWLEENKCCPVCKHELEA